MNEHEYEPVRGLPAELPAGETILWQGSPSWEALARRTLHVRLVAIYFVVLAVWGVASGISSGALAIEIALSTLRLAVLGTVAVGLLTLFAWLVARTTIYTITTGRVVMRFGIAMPMTIQIPFPRIGGAALNRSVDGAGDIALSLPGSQRISYLVLWPHARPWRLARSQPSLRAVPDAVGVAHILGRALSASASQSAQAIPVSVRSDAESGAHLPAAA